VGGNTAVTRIGTIQLNPKRHWRFDLLDYSTETLLLDTELIHSKLSTAAELLLLLPLIIIIIIMAKKKVLLMGKAHSGKTSMRSIIFANYLARDTMRLSPTLDVEHHHVRFLGDLVLNLWDCGGQDAFYESYFERDRETIFRSVELLIYVFDIESDCPEKDFDHFAGVLEAMEENSPDARIFVLVHKMDLVAEEERELILEDRKRLIEESCLGVGVQHFQCFGTSIWDETLYKAWSEIVTNLIPNIGVLESHLSDFCEICDADEVVLFERATFLVISHAQAKKNDVVDDGAASSHRGANITGKIKSHNGDVNEEGIVESRVGGNGGEIENDAAGVDNNNAIMSSSADNVTANNTHRPPSSATAAKSVKRIINSGPPSAPTPQFDAHRFEKISNIVKQFKLSCGKAQSQFQGMDVCNSKFTAFIDAFTANTYIMVIVSHPAGGQDDWGRETRKAATLMNIQKARR
jgi:Ras-related GTP-binding protein A/B